GEIAKAKPGSPTIRFVRTGSGTEGEIRSELQAGRPIILEVPGHWIAAVGLDGDKILINDPYYADRRTLDVYKGKVKSSVLFEQSNDLSGFVITVPKSERVKVTDKAGKVVGTLNTGTEQEVKESVQLGIDGAYYSTKDAWRDPTCVESPPRPGDGTIQIFLPGNKDEYKIEVLSPDGGPTTAAFHRYDKTGKYSFESKDNTGPAVIAASFDPVNVAAGSSSTIPGAFPTAENRPSGGGGGVGAGGAGAATGTATPPSGGATTTTATVSAGGSPTASPTGTRIPPTAAPVAPSSVGVACQVAYNATPKSATVSCTANVAGTYTTTAWTVNGVPAPAPPGATTFTTTFSDNTVASVSMTACNSAACTAGAQAVTVKFPPPGATTTPAPSPTVNPSATPTPPAGSAPPMVPISCSYVPGSAPSQVNCVVSFSEPYTDITWTATNGTPTTVTNSSKTFTTYRDGSSGTVTVRARVCYYASCTTSADAVVSPPSDSAAPLLVATSTSANAEYVCANSSTDLFGSVSGGSTPTGTVTLTVDAGAAGSATLSGGSWSRTHPQELASQPATHSFTASYSGDATHAPSSASGTFSFPGCG
ncbi:MAG: Ig-like domain repeat protein, partial [Tepidiformaceae bacterium]